MPNSPISTRRILAAGVAVSNDTRITGRNNNDLIIGPPGASKTRGYVIPNILENNSDSMIITDVKGNLRRQFGPYLKRKGFKVLDVDFIDISQSKSGYNPFDFIRTTKKGKPNEQDILTIAAAISPVTSLKEPFWENASALYLSCFIAYILNCLPVSEHNLISLSRLTEYIGTPVLDALFRELEDIQPDCLAVKRYKQIQVLSTSEKTHASIMGILYEKLSPLCFEGAEKLYSNSSRIDFSSLGKEKTIVFLTVSDTDRSMDSLVSLFYTQALQVLCKTADNSPNSRLAIPVRLMLDDFSSNTFLPDFDKTSSTVRSRDIYLSIIIQGLSQLEAAYGPAKAETIINNFDTLLYLGGNELRSAHHIASRADKPLARILTMPTDQAILMMRGQQPKLVNKYQLEDHPTYIELMVEEVERSLHDKDEGLYSSENFI